VFQQGWAWGALGAVAMVLAAMYALRLISAVLHRDPGSAVSDAALDLRPAELGVVVPLVACLLALSAWPAAISGHAFGGNQAATPTVTKQAKSSFQNEARAAGPRWAARCVVLSRPNSDAIGAPCVLASHSPNAPQQRVVISK
jgi:hypothetical protein